MTVLSYSSQIDVKLLDAITVGASRRALVDDTVRAVRDELGRNRHQHRLLLGPRGSGKTHTLALVRDRIESSPETKERVAVLAPPEENVVRGPEEVPVRLLEHLAAWLDAHRGVKGHDGAERTVETALAKLARERNARATLDLAIEALDRAGTQLGRLIVGIVENADLLLYTGRDPDWGSDAEKIHWALRDHLQKTRRLVLLAATPPYSEALRDHAAPYYGLFATTQLEPLSADEMVALFKQRLQAERGDSRQSPEVRQRLARVEDGLAQREAQLRTLLVFIGGLPRFGHLVFDVLVETDVRDAMDALARLLDAQTPYFQARLDPRLLARGEMEIFEALAMAVEAQTPTEIAEKLRTRPANEVGVALKRLKGLGLVDADPRGRKGAWDITEPLYRVWRRFRGGRTQREQLAALGEFLCALFERGQLIAEKEFLERQQPGSLRLKLLETALSRDASRVPALAAEAQRHGEKPDTELARLWNNAEREYLKGTLPEARRLFGQYVERARAGGDRVALARGLIRLGEVSLFGGGAPLAALTLIEEALGLARQLGDRTLEAYAVLGQGAVHFRLDRNEEAQQALDAAEKLYVAVGSDLGRAHAVLRQGDLHLFLGRNEEAQQAFEVAEKLCVAAGSDLGRAIVVGHRGLFDLSQGRFSSALDLFFACAQIEQRIQARFNLSITRGWIANAIEKCLEAGEADRALGYLPRYLELSGPCLAESEKDRAALSRIAATVARTITPPERALGTLVEMEAVLPEPWRDLLRLARLAAEIRAGRRPDSLPGEPIEVRRGVGFVLDRDKAGKEPLR
ncbi:MAG: hypothetical protein HY744_22860 [Deltaproteobacteria bacterium]|nr:hypothetical protein [Deltaproteobacteria bacterium]